MSQVLYTDLFPEVLEHCPQCPDDFVMRHLQRVAQGFCEETRAWQQSLAAIPSVAGQADYTIDPPTNAEVTLVLWVNVGAHRYEVRSGANARSMAREQRGSRVVVVSGLQATLLPAPSQDDVDIVFDVALRPVFVSEFTAALEIPQQIEEHAGVIAKGAASTLLAIPGHPWSNPVQSGYLGAQFLEYKKRIAAKVGIGSMKSNKRAARFY